MMTLVNGILLIGLFGPIVALLGLIVYEGYLTLSGDSRATFPRTTMSNTNTSTSKIASGE